MPAPLVPLWISPSAAPGPLPESTTDLWPQVFLTRAIRKDWRLMVGAAVTCLGFAGIWAFAVPYMPATLATIFPLLYFMFTLAALLWIATRWTVRPAVVVMKDATGRDLYDRQEWWAQDERQWPDSWRKTFPKDSLYYKGRRVLVIDAMEYAGNPATLRAFQPEKNPMPLRPQGTAPDYPDAPATQAEIGQVWSVGKNIRTLLGSFTQKQARVKQFWLLVGIMLCLGGVVFLGWNAGNIVTGETREEAIERLMESYRAESQRQAPQQTLPQPQPFQPPPFEAK